MKAAPFAIVATIVTAVTGLAAPRAAASCAGPYVARYAPFFDAVVPQNAELRATAPFDETILQLTLPDGSERTLRMVTDELSLRADFTDAPDLQPLPVGDYHAIFEGYEDYFTVVAGNDDVAPDVPTVSFDKDSHLQVAFPFLECGPSDTRTYTTTALIIDGTSVGDVVIIDGVMATVAATEGSTTVVLYGDRESAEVQLRDAAGNMSEPTFVDASGCGCTSSSPATPLGFMAVLGLLSAVRRRR